MDKRLRNYARILRKDFTNSEIFLWKYLRNNKLKGFKFRRQHPIGRYIVDFVNFEQKIIIEVDGSQHHKNKEKDRIRDKWFRKEGFRVLRFWDSEVLINIEGVLEIIKGELKMPLTPPSPAEERGIKV